MTTRTEVSYPAQRVKAIRLERKLSAEALAERANPGGALNEITKELILNAEKGRKKNFTVAELMQLAAGLQVSVLELLIDFSRPFDAVTEYGLIAPYSQMNNAEYAQANSPSNMRDVFNYYSFSNFPPFTALFADRLAECELSAEIYASLISESQPAAIENLLGNTIISTRNGAHSMVYDVEAGEPSKYLERMASSLRVTLFFRNQIGEYSASLLSDEILVRIENVKKLFVKLARDFDGEIEKLGKPTDSFPPLDPATGELAQGDLSV